MPKKVVKASFGNRRQGADIEIANKAVVKNGQSVTLDLTGDEIKALGRNPGLEIEDVKRKKEEEKQDG